MTTPPSVDMDALFSVTKKLEESFHQINMQLERYLSGRKRSNPHDPHDHIIKSVNKSVQKVSGETQFLDKVLGKKKNSKVNSQGIKKKDIATEIKPKIPMNPFFMYLLEKKEQTRRENPTLKSTEVSALIGEFWNNMTQEQKRPYKEEYYRQKNLYEQNRAKGQGDRSKKEMRMK